MIAAFKEAPDSLEELVTVRVDVAELGMSHRRGWERCGIGENLAFSTARMESYFFARWEPALYDALLVAAAVEFCDRTQRRPARGWGREFELRVPVHEPERWNRSDVLGALHEALSFLTGDRWRLRFYGRGQPQSAPVQGLFDLGSCVAAVIPFSDGLDSRAVAGLAARELGDRLVRVRLGSKEFSGSKLSRRRQPFTAVPYEVRPGARSFVESSARSRGFKFALISGLAAYLAGGGRVIVPESGQGALGPALVSVGQACPDYRNHPLFTQRMEAFLLALLGHRVRFEYPRVWYTKGETLAEFMRECEDAPASWAATRSCWQQNRHVSVDHKARQCGICAACLLRRMSVHAAGLAEPATTYVWEDLGAAAFQGGAAEGFDRRKITGAMREYAIAGALHLDHLAGLRHSRLNARPLGLHAVQLARACGLSEADTRARLDRLLSQHEKEWRNFMDSLGPTSFLTDWVLSGQ